MNTRIAFKSALLAMSALGALSAPTMAQAQGSTAAAEATHDFNVAAQPLARALSAIAEQGDIQIVYPDREPNSITAPAVRGRMTTAQALSAALAGSGYTYRWLREGVVTLVSTEGNADGELVTGVVSVEGTQGSPYFGGAGVAAGVNGINGSRDITATEGTGSFTSGALTIGSKVPQALKDVPQSISVLTSERLEQQNVTDLNDAMRQLPGVTLVQGTISLENTFYSRGFAVTSIQVDGGAPLSTAFGYQPQIDMSQYDHVELLRGAAGQFGAYGQPGGTVNLVRKKPLDHAQFALELQAGSSDTYRAVMDASSPLALNGALRGRLVMTYQDNKHFYDTAKDNKTLVYGIVELDATPATLLTAGISYTRQDSVPWLNGLPRYLDGDDLMLPRSTCLCFAWNRWDFETTEIFGGIEQKIGPDWTFKLNLTRNRQASTQKLGYSSGAVNPTNGLGPLLTGVYNDYASKQFSAEATLSGAFSLFGQRQEVTIGANRVSSDGAQAFYGSLISGTAAAPYQPYPGGPLFYSGSPNGRRPPIDVFDFDPADPIYTEPRNPLPSFRYPENGQIQSGAYVNLRLTAFEHLHLTTGLRWSRYESNFAYEDLCATTTDDCADKAIGDAYYTYALTYRDDDISWPPPVTLSFDVTNALTVYAGYTDIYQSQANQLDADLNPLPPVTGGNWEGGVKWAALGGKLNLSLAAYRIQQKGFGITDPDNPDFLEVSPGVTCCYVSDANYIYESKGLDLEATGEVRPGWQVAASYTWNDNQYKGSISELYGQAGLPLVTIAPKHLYKLWMSYDFGAAGHAAPLSRLAISAGVNGQSAGYNEGSTCVNLSGTPNPITGAQSCASDGPPDRVPFRFTVPPYAVVSARIDYRLSDRWSLAVNLDNIFDKTYYQTTSNSVSSGHWYGAPRSVTATLRAKW